MDDPQTKQFAEVFASAEYRYSILECFKRYLWALMLYFRMLRLYPKFWVGVSIRAAPATFRTRLNSVPTAFKVLWACLGFPICIPCRALLYAWQPETSALKTLEDSQFRVEGAAKGPFHRFAHGLYFSLVATLAASFSWKGTNTARDWDKRYWRQVISNNGNFAPPELGQALCSTKQVTWNCDLPSKDVVLKARFSSLGHGDRFLTFGTDFTTKEEFEHKCVEHLHTIKGKDKDQFLILERVMPDKEFGVHSIEIVTAKTSAGNVIVLRTAFMHGSNTSSSHQCRSCYVVDPISEVIVAPGQWLRTRAAWAMDPKMPIGYRLPGVRDACAAAVKMHTDILLKDPTSLTFIGWDCMFKEDGGVVWFEGNPCNLRLASIMCCSLSSMKAFASLVSF